jgi:glycosyltransferase involved in cell wall biosynthesis
MPTLSLIIPAYNEEKYLGECLKYVFKNADGIFSEIIVVDNASTDGTASVAEKFPGVRVVREDQKGLTHARQRGYMESKGDILVYIDADTQVPAGWGPQIAPVFQNQNIATLSGPYVYYDIPRFQKMLVWIYWHFLAVPAYFFVGYMVIGGNFAIRRTTLEKMNGFDTSIAFYGEDTNIARRASKFGKSKFKTSFYMHTSGRRLAGQGVLATAFVYLKNFLSEALLHRPVTQNYTDIR